MNFKKFLLAKEPDFKGRAIQDIWSFSDEQIEHTHDYIQLLFPLNEQSSAVFHGYYLNTLSSIGAIKSNDLAKENILKSSKWFLGFLERNRHWRRRKDHNYLRITRIIKSLRLLVSDQEADFFYQSILEILNDEEKSKINHETLSYWNNA